MRSAGPVVGAMIGLSACASAARPPSAPPPAVPAIAVSKPTMTSAPYAQTFVWVAPSAIFAGVTASDDSAGNWGPTEGLMRSVAIPLAELGWRESAADSANFRVAVLYAERTEIVNVRQWEPPPRRERPVPSREPVNPRGSPDAPRPVPVPLDPQSTQPTVQHAATRVLVVAQYRGFVIERVSDGALFYRIVKGGDQRSAERTFARLVVQLIHQTPTP